MDSHKHLLQETSLFHHSLRVNHRKEHAQALAYMKGDMAEGVAEIVFDEEDVYSSGVCSLMKL